MHTKKLLKPSGSSTFVKILCQFTSNFEAQKLCDRSLKTDRNKEASYSEKPRGNLRETRRSSEFDTETTE